MNLDIPDSFEKTIVTQYFVKHVEEVYRRSSVSNLLFFETILSLNDFDHDHF